MYHPVVTPAWESTNGAMGRLEKAGETWRIADDPVTVGHRGIGIGLHPGGLAGPERREGDHRAPAVFQIESAFGTEEVKLPRFPYRHTTEPDRWVDDTASSHCNQWVRHGDPAVRQCWNSGEVLRRKDGLYDLALFVGRNRGPVVKGRWSAILESLAPR